MPGAPIQSLGTCLSMLLGATTAILLAWVIIPEFAPLALLLSLASGVVTIVWLYRARSNVEGLSSQRHSKGWAIGGWFCPFVNLWFPFQIVADIARSDPPVRPALAGPAICYAWWVCWLLSWATGAYLREGRTVRSDGSVTTFSQFGVNFGGTTPSKLFGAAAALLLALIVSEISTRQERRARRFRR